MAARIGKQLQVVTPNKVGMLAEVTGIIADSGVNIDAFCAFRKGNKACFLVITNDNAKAAKALKTKKFKVKEEKVVMVDLDNRVGTAVELGNKLKEAKVDLSYIYGTTCGSGPATIVFKSNKDAKAIEVLA